MTYAEKLAEFVKATGSKPGEMNRVACPHPKRLTEDCPRCLRRAGTPPNVSPSWVRENT